MASPYPFVSGAVLTAANLNSISELPTRTLTSSGAAVAADSYSRVILNGTSITYTINTSTFTAGQVVELYNANSTAATIAAGSGVTLNGASGLTLAQYQAGQIYAVSATSFILFRSDVTVTSSPFVLITSATFSAVASVSMPAGTFTTTYKNYRVFFHATSTSTGQNVGVRVNVSGTAQTASNYYGGWVSSDNNATIGGFGSNANSSAVFINLASGQSGYGEFTVYDPTNATTKTWWSGTAVGANSAGNSAGTAGGNLYNVAAAHDGLTFVVGGTMTGSYYVYGLSN